MGRLLGDMREDDEVPWEWVADNTRWKRRPVTYTGLSDGLYSMAHGYRRNLWADAEEYVEIWVEKDALAGVLVEVTDPLDVPLMVAKGYTSKSYAYGAAEDIAAEMEKLKRVFVYHLGDSDPSGEDAARDVEAKLRRYVEKIGGDEVEIHFERVAVLDEQIQRWNLPLRPNKQSDTRTKKFHGRPARSNSTLFRLASFARSLATASRPTLTKNCTPPSRGRRRAKRSGLCSSHPFSAKGTAGGCFSVSGDPDAARGRPPGSKNKPKASWVVMKTVISPAITA